MTAPSRSSQIKDLVLLFSIPLGVSLLAAAVVYVPQLLAKPAYDFVYSYCDAYECADSYSLTADSRVLQNPSTSPRFGELPKARLGYYSAATGATRIITYGEAQGYALLNSSVSPDGYTLVRDSGKGGFLFWDGGERSWQLENGMKKRQVRLNGDSQSYYSDNITLLGWVRQ